jgi:hypothetical protein
MFLSFFGFRAISSNERNRVRTAFPEQRKSAKGGSLSGGGGGKRRNGSLTFYISLWQLLLLVGKSVNIFLTSPIGGRYFNLRLVTPLPPLL